MTTYAVCKRPTVSVAELAAAEDVERAALQQWLSGAAPADDAKTTAAVKVKPNSAAHVLPVPLWQIVGDYAFVPSYPLRARQLVSHIERACPAEADSGRAYDVTTLEVHVGTALPTGTSSDALSRMRYIQKWTLVPAPGTAASSTDELQNWYSAYDMTRLGRDDDGLDAAYTTAHDTAERLVRALINDYGCWPPTRSQADIDAGVGADADADADAAAAAAADSNGAAAKSQAARLPEWSVELARTNYDVYTVVRIQPPADIDAGKRRRLCDAHAGASRAWPVVHMFVGEHVD